MNRESNKQNSDNIRNLKTGDMPKKPKNSKNAAANNETDESAPQMEGQVSEDAVMNELQKMAADDSENNGDDNVTDEPDELQKSKNLALENYERFMRVSADFENLRKRTEKERVDLIRFGNESLFKDLLPVFDSFQKAIPSDDTETADEKGSSDEFSKGMGLILKQLTDVLKKNGLQEIVSAGEKFDPNFHQAIQRIDSPDVTEETVKDEFVKGYLLHDRLVRPAMVSVLVPVAETTSES